MRFLSVASLMDKYDLSESTVRRIYRRMKESGEYAYMKDYLTVAPRMVRINEESFLREVTK